MDNDGDMELMRTLFMAIAATEIGSIFIAATEFLWYFRVCRFVLMLVLVLALVLLLVVGGRPLAVVELAAVIKPLLGNGE